MSTKAKKQSTYSFPYSVREWLNQFLNNNKEDLSLIGITNETRLFEVLARNGEPAVTKLLAQIRENRKANTNPLP
ncbi:hypothetical protein [Candidatus Bathycorpusculum sp.]|jgi:hypothetical protein|uniref:hypothetical protein n=1 Tax=Candidatus Bathycorpusculum sp. TaxID=2994959 RepID=UPI002839A275|nr:hypothetical protein [Candidatus Termitimicrobium sp.]